MGYSNITLITNILANTLTSASPLNLNQPTDLMNIGRTLDFNVLDTDTINQYIKWADEEINSAVSELYVTPLCMKSDFETTLLSDINDYNDFVITTDSCPFYVGDVIMLINGAIEERHIIAEILDSEESNVFRTVDPISYEFPASSTRVIRIKYPEPIALVSARWAAANVYEKYFMAEASPSQSDYGKWLRGLAKADINNILNGRTILHGQHRIGRRFYNPTLVDQYGLPQEKGKTDMEIGE
jgi:hypothetical protein